MSLIDYEHLCAARFPMNTKPPALVDRTDVCRYELHGRRPGARRVRRYLRRQKQRDAAWKAEWLRHPFAAGFDPEGRHWPTYRRLMCEPPAWVSPKPLRIAVESDGIPMRFLHAPLVLTRPSVFCQIASVE